MELKLFNTESREKEVVFPHHNGVIRMYTCGPTVYDFAHIGNFRTYVFEDLLRRTIQFFGMKVHHVMNITDIDDKTMKGAITKNIPLKQYTEPFRIAFLEDLQKLNILKADQFPAATDFIPQMIEMVQTLLDKGFAYISPNKSVYFSIKKFPTYGRLSHLNLSDLKVNASGDNEGDEYTKDNIADFVIWKAYDPERDGKIFWESPFGPGRPGWHIECSAMSKEYLGDDIDIHCGGVDNMFPHHENEIAQSEACSGHHFVHHWVHVEHLLVDHKKMSKSLGNFYTLRNLLDRGYSGPEVRYLLLSTHYRTQLNFTMQGLDAARASLSRMEDLITRLRQITSDIQTNYATGPIERADLRFKTALADDINISSALAALFDLIRELNVLCDEQKIGHNEAQLALQYFTQWDQVLGLIPLHSKQEEVPHDLLQFLEQRETARREKNWKQSDAMRDAIHARGYVIEDTPQGARLKKR
jgi:cysteinyl-tRNA synthetase